MAKADITTIKLNKKTKERLEKLRVHKRETYDEILQSMLGILNICRTDPDTAQEKLHEIERKTRKKKVVQRDKEE
jgi:hypothetical protein